MIAKTISTVLAPEDYGHGRLRLHAFSTRKVRSMEGLGCILRERLGGRTLMKDHLPTILRELPQR